MGDLSHQYPALSKDLICRLMALTARQDRETRDC